MKIPPTPQPKYWQYDLGNGWVVYAGKTAVDNDLISTRFALRTDHWFHLNGQPGSHVLLRGPEGAKPDSTLLQQAANIAAYHSKARGGGGCRVDYCLACNVSKPPRVPAGEVHIKNFKVMKARPELPPQPPAGESA